MTAATDAADEELDVLDGYFDALLRGEVVGPEEWLARFPDASEALREELRTIASLHDVAHSLAQDALLPDDDADAAPTPARPLLAPGERLGDCTIEELVGYGGMGEVYLALHEELGREVAVKVLRGVHADDPGAVARFRQEVQAQARMSPHPNVVAALHASEHRGRVYLVMEYVRGTDLQRVVADEGPLPVERACDLVKQAAAGLGHAHRHGVVHRDVKPSNLLLDRAGAVKVTDLGLARLAIGGGDDEASRRFADELVGSLDYMAPEQADDPDAVDARSDLYALGCTFYTLLTGRPPFAGRLMLKKLMAHATEAPESVRAARPEIPEPVARIVARLLEKRPEDRYASARELVDALDEVAPGGSTRARAPSSARDGRPPAPRVAGPLLGGLAVGALLAGLAAWATWPGEPLDPSAPAPAPVPASARLSPERPVLGRLAADAPTSPKTGAPYAAHTLNVEGGHTYALELRSRDFDPHLSARGRFESLENADAPGRGHVAHLVIGAAEAGEVELLAGAERAGQTGAYLLSVEELRMPRLVVGAAPLAGRLEDGDARLPSDDTLHDPHWIALEGGETYVVHMRAEGFEPYLVLHDSDWEVLAQSPRAEDGAEVRVPYTSRGGGPVYVAANAYAAGAGGDYTIWVERPDEQARSLLDVDGELAEGDLVLESDDSLYDRHAVAVRGGHGYIVTMRSDAFEPYLLLERGGRRVGVRPSRIDGGVRFLWEAPEDGEVVVLANSQRAGRTGAYRLTVRED